MRNPIGILLLQTGTPSEPTPRAVRAYLKRFLGDPRVIEAPRLLWWFILNGIILPFRSPKSAAKYRSIWDPETGSPLLHFTRVQADRLGELLGSGFEVRYAMRYSEPFIPDTIHELAGNGVDRILLFPMYPQYSATTTASVLDEVWRTFQSMRAVPSVRVVPPFYAHPGYIDAQARRIASEVEGQGGDVGQLLLSFHGIPKAYAERGDPYPGQCEETFRFLREKLPLPADRVRLTFQSRFGRQEWLTPYTDETLMQLARAGCRQAWIAAPGFPADCLETLEELGKENAHLFKEAGGTRLTAIPCLNDFRPWIETMKTIVLEETEGWR
jgi:ferrochelatase